MNVEQQERVKKTFDIENKGELLHSLVQDFIAFEQRCDLFRFKCRGLIVWDYIRNYVFWEIFRQKYQKRRVAIQRVKKSTRLYI